MKVRLALKSIRWTARISGTLLVLFCLVFFIRSIVEGLSKPASSSVLEPYNMVLFALWGVGLASYILAWWKEGLGGIVSFICLTLFNILAAFNPVEGSSYTPILLLFIVPSLLYLVYWRLNTN